MSAPTEDDVLELQARVVEAESLVKVLRQRSLADQMTIQRAAAEITALHQRLADAHDAYEQLAQLVTTNPANE